MPHIAPKTRAAKSPFDINEPLRIIADAGINLMGIGGSNHEFNGLLSVMVAHDQDVDQIVELWQAAGYKDARGYGEPDGVHLDYAEDQPGGLLAAVIRGRRHHPGGVVSDITVGVSRITFWLDGNGDVVRDDKGYPVEDGNSGGDPKELFPVQIYFLVTPGRTGGGDPVPA